MSATVTPVSHVLLHASDGFPPPEPPNAERRRLLILLPRGARLAIMQRFRHVRFLARRLCSGSLNEFRHNLATDEWVVFSLRAAQDQREL